MRNAWTLPSCKITAWNNGIALSSSNFKHQTTHKNKQQSAIGCSYFNKCTLMNSEHWTESGYKRERQDEKKDYGARHHKYK